MIALLCLSSLFPFSFMLKHGNRKYLCTFVSMKTFVIAGCGRLAGIVSEAVVKGLLPEYELVGVYSRTVAKAERIAGRMAEAGKSCAVCTTADELLALKPDILVETASPAALREFAVPALKNGTSIVTLSIGALADDAFYREVCETAKENGTRIYIASGATGGFDVLRTAALMGKATARFYNEKGPDALKGTPVYEEALQKEQKVVFTGNAVEAILKDWPVPFRSDGRTLGGCGLSRPVRIVHADAPKGEHLPRRRRYRKNKGYCPITI